MIELIYSIIGIQMIIFLAIGMSILTYNSIKEYFKNRYEEEIKKLEEKNMSLKMELEYYKENK